jgi:ribosome-interacting GTPase 1
MQMPALRLGAEGSGEWGPELDQAEMARTQKNKATSYHLGLLKARIAKLRSELISAATPKGV